MTSVELLEEMDYIKGGLKDSLYHITDVDGDTYEYADSVVVRRLIQRLEDLTKKRYVHESSI